MFYVDSRLREGDYARLSCWSYKNAICKYICKSSVKSWPSTDGVTRETESLIAGSSLESQPGPSPESMIFFGQRIKRGKAPMEQ